MDTELFELCKEVYERSGWDDTKDFWWWDKRLYTPGSKPVSEGFELSEYIHNEFIDDDKQEGCPNYTSDYLLEKLPSNIKSKEYPGENAFLWTRKDDDSLDKYSEGEVTYFAWYFVAGEIDGVSDYGAYSDTPLKALLKLILALSEDGILTKEVV